MIVYFAGYGVFATADIKCGEFVMDYVGRLMSQQEAADLADHTYVFDFNIGTLFYRYVTKLLDSLMLDEDVEVC
jgi:SET domain-containing protein